MDNEEIIDALHRKAEEIPVPDGLSPEQIEKKVKDMRQEQRGWHLAARGKLALAAAALTAMCLVGAGAMMSGQNPMNFGDGTKETVVEEDGAGKDENNGTTEADGQGGDMEESGTTYEDIYHLLRTQKNTYDEYDGVVAEKDGFLASELRKSVEDNAGSSQSRADYSETDTQVAGVMEGDVVKTDGTHLFCLKRTTKGCTVTIYRVEGPRVKKISQIEQTEQTIRELYIEGGTLITLGTSWNSSTYGEEATAEKKRRIMTDIVADETGDKTQITFYDIGNPEKPKKLWTQEQDGIFNTSRVADGYLYTFTRYGVETARYMQKMKKDKPEGFVPQVGGEVIPAAKIRILDKKNITSYMIMTSLNIGDGSKFADSQALLGSFRTYYMNQDHVYAVSSDMGEADEEHCTIAKYTCRDGRFSFDAKTKIRGRIDNSYYMHEYKDNFVFVYTRQKKDKTTNGLCVLDARLELVGEIGSLGVNERIYSSYFIDNMAYFVTYRETDPVFAVDIGNPAKPELKSELKLPGFSSYLHSFGDGRLIGIGYGAKKGEEETNGNSRVKLSLFSIGEDYDIKEIDRQFGKKFTNCYATDNHRAVFVDQERGLVGFTMNEYAEHYTSSYFVYKYEEGGFQKVLSHALDKDTYAENVRGIRIGNYFYVVDTEGGIEVFDMATWKAV